MVVPKDVRVSLGIDGKDANIVIGCYGEPCLQVYRTDVFDRISASMTRLGASPDAVKKRRDFKLWHGEVQVDSSGRCTIPDFLREPSGVKDKYDQKITEGLIPDARWGTPDDVGRAVAALLRGDVPYATGTVLHIDGGLTIPRL